MKRVLLLSHYFEPYRLIGSRRSTYLADLLTENGYEVIVLRAHTDSYGKDIVNLDTKQNYSVFQLRIDNESTPFMSEGRKWYFEYRKQIKRIIKRLAIGCMYICGNPFFYFTLGSYFKKECNIPYLLDFRDPWYQDLRLKKRMKNSLLASMTFSIRNYVNKIKEKKAVKDACYIINVTRRRTEVYKRYYNFVDPSRFITIPNGYDDRKISGISFAFSEPMPDNVCKIGIFGKFSYYDRTSVQLLIAGCLKLLGSIRLDVHHWGEDERYFVEYVEKHHLSDIVKFHGHVDYLSGLKSLSRMNCFVLNNRDNRSQGTKIFDYILLNKPIIAFISKDSEIADVLSNFRNSFVVKTADDFVNAVCLIRQNRIESLDDNIDIQKYSRRAAMVKLLKYIDRSLA